MILETMSWILKNVNVGVDRLIVGYGVRFVYSVCHIIYYHGDKKYVHILV